MVDLQKEHVAFEGSLSVWITHLDFYLQTWEEVSNSYACMTIQWYWEVWLNRAKLAQQEKQKLINERDHASLVCDSAIEEIGGLKAKLDAKHKAFIFLDDCRIEWYKAFMRKCEENKQLKSKLAEYESKDVAVVPREPNFDMLNDGWSAIGYDSIDESDIASVYKAMIKAGEIK